MNRKNVVVVVQQGTRQNPKEKRREVKQVSERWNDEIKEKEEEAECLFWGVPDVPDV